MCNIVSLDPAEARARERAFIASEFEHARAIDAFRRTPAGEAWRRARYAQDVAAREARPVRPYWRDLAALTPAQRLAHRRAQRATSVRRCRALAALLRRFPVTPSRLALMIGQRKRAQFRAREQAEARAEIQNEDWFAEACGAHERPQINTPPTRVETFWQQLAARAAPARADALLERHALARTRRWVEAARASAAPGAYLPGVSEQAQANHRRLILSRLRRTLRDHVTAAWCDDFRALEAQRRHERMMAA